MKEKENLPPDKSGLERDGFFELYGISKEEEEFFKMIYRRRKIYRRIIMALSGLTITLLLTLLLSK